MSNKIKNIPELHKSTVKMKDVEIVYDKINKLAAGKYKKLQIITDFDFTISKYHAEGKTCYSSFGLLSVWDELPPGFLDRDNEIKAKYHPIEIDIHMTAEEKIPYMEEWYKLVENNWKGKTLPMEGLRKLIAEKKPPLRDGTVELCKVLKKNKIPLLVLSAGMGDVITEVMRYHGLLAGDNVHVVSNFFQMQNGVITGYHCKENGFYIHPFNKNCIGCDDYFKKVGLGRNNVILLGDSLGDATMERGVPQLNCVLKIGFLQGSEEVMTKSLPKYLETFDIVLIDDQTMEIVRAIINRIKP